MRRRFFLVSNPGAGLAGVSLVADVVRSLQQAGAAVTHATPVDAGASRAAVRRAADSGAFDAIIAAGGDGTIRQSATALISQPTPLGIIPVGTGNVLAHEIGLSPTPAAVSRMLLHGPVVQAMCARANGEPFLLMTGAGFDARVLAALDHRLKSRIGKAAYAGPLLGALISPVDQLSLMIDGRLHTASWAVIANARHYGGSFVLAPHVGIRQRGLEAILFKARTQGVLAGQLMGLALGQLDAHAARGDVAMLPCTRVVITARKPVPTQIDGDVLGTTPLEIDAGSDEVSLIVP